MITTKTVTTLAALALAALALSAVPSSAASFTLQLGGPLNLVPHNDDTGIPDTGKPQVRFQVHLGGPDIMDDQEAPLPPPMTKADIEQANHQCEVVKKIEVLLNEMNDTLKGYYRIGDTTGANSEIEDIKYWQNRLRITKLECYKVYV